MCKNNIFVSSFIDVIMQWHSCYTINCSHLRPGISDHSTFTCLYPTKKFSVHLHYHLDLRWHKNLCHSCTCSESSEASSCWSCNWMSEAVVSTSSGEGSVGKTTWSAGEYEGRYILRGSVPALNFVFSWRTLRWRAALPLPQAYSLIWSFCLELSCLVWFKVAHSWNSMKTLCLFDNMIIRWVMMWSIYEIFICVLRWSFFTFIYNRSTHMNYFIHTSHHFTPHGKIWTQLVDLAPNVWLHSSVGRASHRYCGGHGFESRWSPDFFSGLFFPTA